MNSSPSTVTSSRYIDVLLGLASVALILAAFVISFW